MNRDSKYPTPATLAPQIWSVTWGTERAVPVLASFPDATTTFYATSRSRRFALLGSSDGRVRVTPVHQTPTEAPAPVGPAAAGRPWEGSLHDMDRGSVAAVALSADDSFMLSAGRDGSLYLCAVDLSAWGMAPAPSSSRAAEEGAVCELDSLPEAPADIVDPEAYSVEEEKQKAEKDAMVGLVGARLVFFGCYAQTGNENGCVGLIPGTPRGLSFGEEGYFLLCLGWSMRKRGKLSGGDQVGSQS